jgi:hypothetical protein
MTNAVAGSNGGAMRGPPAVRPCARTGSRSAGSAAAKWKIQSIRPVRSFDASRKITTRFSIRAGRSRPPPGRVRERFDRRAGGDAGHAGRAIARDRANLRREAGDAIDEIASPAHAAVRSTPTEGTIAASLAARSPSGSTPKKSRASAVTVQRSNASRAETPP